jgi:flagellar motor switch protein FliM
VPLFEGKYGVMNGRYAVKINEFLNVPQDANFAGERHAQ